MVAWFIPVALAAGQAMLGQHQKETSAKDAALAAALQKRRGEVAQPPPSSRPDVGALMSIGGAAMGGMGGNAKTSAISARMDTANAGNILAQGQKALETQPPEIQQAYGPVLNEAMRRHQNEMMARQKERRGY